MPWIGVAKDAPYFVEDNGAAWTPIGQNDAISWPELAPLFRRRDLPAVERHLRYLRAHGVTCLRLMLEYAHDRHRFIERPAGRFVPAMVQLWDDLFALCERVRIRVLLTPLDTFWMWRRWAHHPWNRANGGPLRSMREALTCTDTRRALKARLSFAVRRWGGSGALFAWDLWNEIHPAHGGGDVTCWNDAIHDLSSHVRQLELQLYGRSHPQTVSLFGPELQLKPDLPMRAPIFRHPDLDFASLHIYAKGTIDNPRNTIAPAVSMGELVRGSLAEITDSRPFLDTEHGPIHAFLDRKRTLPEAFDDEYFRHLAWAHLACGAAGGGMRWPNRHPHVLTHGMRRAQQAMSAFLPLIDWTRFNRRAIAQTKLPDFHLFGCSDDRQALLWLLRRHPAGPAGQVRRDLTPLLPSVEIAGLQDGTYRVRGWDTETGRPVDDFRAAATNSRLHFSPTAPIVGDRAFAIARI